MSDAARRNADAVKAEMLRGEFAIFQGPLADNRGKTVIAAGGVRLQTDPELEKTSYLVEGVAGSA